jgi:hypothetical protein
VITWRTPRVHGLQNPRCVFPYCFSNSSRVGVSAPTGATTVDGVPNIYVADGCRRAHRSTLISHPLGRQAADVNGSKTSTPASQHPTWTVQYQPGETQSCLR